MSRSIHDTRGVLARTRRESYADLGEKLERLRELRANIAEQRALKAQARHRRRRRGITVPPFDADTVPVLASNQGTYVHHSATEEDVRAVLRRLPPGTLDGLTAIHLCQCDRPPRRSRNANPIDPHTGRPGHEVLPSVYFGEARGDCTFGGGRVRVFAHIHPPGAAGVHAVYLKLCALATLVHECSHHFDDTFRGDGERWHKSDYERNEAYVRARALELVATCVVPYLEERYPSDCRALAEWMEQHGGLALPLALLTDNRDVHRAAADYAYRELARGVAAGEDPAELRRDFGSALSFGGHHREAVLVLERAIAKRPDDLETMLGLGFARVHAGRVEEAEALQARLREMAPEDARTWILEARIHQRCARWEPQVRAADRALALRPADDERRRLPLAYRADAWLGLERWDDFAADVAALQAIGTPGARAQAEVLTLRRLCRTERWGEGLAGASRLLRGTRLGPTDRAFAEAVRFACAHRLGRPSAAGKLDPHAVEMLRSCGQGAWLDRLTADFGR